MFVYTSEDRGNLCIHICVCMYKNLHVIYLYVYGSVYVRVCVYLCCYYNVIRAGSDPFAEAKSIVSCSVSRPAGHRSCKMTRIQTTTRTPILCASWCCCMWRLATWATNWWNRWWPRTSGIQQLVKMYERFVSRYVCYILLLSLCCYCTARILHQPQLQGTFPVPLNVLWNAAASLDTNIHTYERTNGRVTYFRENVTKKRLFVTGTVLCSFYIYVLPLWKWKCEHNDERTSGQLGKRLYIFFI